MRSVPTLTSLALIGLLAACASGPPLAPSITGIYDLVSMDGQPLPSKDNVVDGTLQLRGNRSFTWDFTMQEMDQRGTRKLVPVVFEGRFAATEKSPSGFLIRLTRRDRASSLSGSEEEIEGTLEDGTLTFASPDLKAVFRRRN